MGHGVVETIDKDSFPDVIEKAIAAKEIINVFESYGVYEMLIHRAEKRFYVTFVPDKQNKTSRMVYRTFDEECIYKRDSIVKSGWEFY